MEANDIALWRQKFKRVKEGLDEEQVMSAISSLAERNNELLAKLEHVQSLTKLAERTIIEAEKLAEDTRKEIEEKAKAEGASIIAQAQETARAEAQAILGEAQKAKEESEAAIAEAREQAKAESEKLVTEAREQAHSEAERIVGEAQRKGQQIIEEKTSEAEEQGQTIIKAAEDQAESLRSEARSQAQKTVSEAHDRAMTADRQAQELLAEAEEKVSSIKLAAQEESERITSEATKKAGLLVQTSLAKAEAEGKRILDAAVAKARADAEEIKREAELILANSKELAEEHVKEKFKKVYEELLSELYGGTIPVPNIQPTDVSPKEEEEPAAQPELPLDEIEDQPVSSVEAEEEPVEGEKEDLRASPEELEAKDGVLYQGTVELVIPPPVGLDRMLQLHKNLRHITQIEVLNLGVSRDKGITIRLFAEKPVPLLALLSELPEVEDAVEDGKGTSAQGEKVTRVRVSTRK